MRREGTATEPTAILVPGSENDTLPGPSRTMAHDTDPTWPPSRPAAHASSSLPHAADPTPVAAAVTDEIAPDLGSTDPGEPPAITGDDVLLQGIRHRRAPPKINPRVLAATDGDTAAAYYVGPRELNTRVDTPPPEPAVELLVTAPLPLPILPSAANTTPQAAPLPTPPANLPSVQPSVEPIAAAAALPARSVHAANDRDASRAETFIVRPRALPRHMGKMMLAIIGLGTVIAAWVLSAGEGPGGSASAATPSSGKGAASAIPVLVVGAAASEHVVAPTSPTSSSTAPDPSAQAVASSIAPVTASARAPQPSATAVLASAPARPSAARSARPAPAAAVAPTPSSPSAASSPPTPQFRPDLSTIQ